VKRRELKDRTLQEAALRAGLRMVQIDIEIGVEFYEQTARYFRKRIRTQKENYDAKPASYWEQDVGYGTTRGDLASEEYQESQEMLQLNSYFAVLTIFAAFERFLLRTFQDMKGLKLVKDKWQKKQPYLTLDGYKDGLKAIGIHLAKPPFKWSDILRLQDFRNTIAHQNGFVTEENIKRLRGYRYKIGQRIDIEGKYFRTAVDLVKDSCSQLVNEYGGVLRKRGRRKKIR
jgi:hypothetical protein